jgi:16S rRNA processing protein RimM
VRGELRVEIITAFPELLEKHQSFILSSPRAPDEGTEYAVETLRFHAGILLLKLAGCDDRNAAELLRGMLVQVPAESAVPLESGEHYQFQIIGLAVETDAGQRLGKVVQVLETGANDVYVIRGPFGEILLPAVDEVVREVDPASGRMVVHLLPGLVDDELL